MAVRVAAMIKKLILQEKMAVTGGVAKNQGVVQNHERILRIKFIHLPVDPQIIGALGAVHITPESLKYNVL